MTDYVPGRVSVIVPAYNHAAYVRECIDSALNQTYPDVEVVVVDDGSTDGTYEILRTYGDRITLIRQENRGTQAARNTAIRASTGEFIALLDSDDVWLPHKLERQIPLLADQRVGLVYGYAYRVDASGQISDGGRPFGEVMPATLSQVEALLIRNPVPTLSAVFRRTCISSLGGFDEAFVGIADRDMWLRIASRWRVLCLPEPEGYYSVHPLNTTKMLYQTKLAYEERRAVLAKARTSTFAEQVSMEVWKQAEAEAELLGADVEALADNAEATAQHLSAAYSLSPDVLAAFPGLQQRVLGYALAGRQCGDWTGASRFAAQVFDAMDGRGFHLRAERREVLAELSLGEAFQHYHAPGQEGVRGPLFVALVGKPSYLTNRGVLSLLGTAVLGRTVMNALRPVVRRLLCPPSP